MRQQQSNDATRNEQKMQQQNTNQNKQQLNTRPSAVKSTTNKKLNIAIIVLSAVLTVLVIFIVCFFCYQSCSIAPEEEETPTAVNDSQAESAPAAPSASKSPAMEATESGVTQLVSQYGGNVAVAVMPLDGQALGFNINGGQQFVSASMIKLLILANYIEACDAGRINGSSTYTVKSSDIVGGTGSIQGSGAGRTYTYNELAHLMIKCSDNTATNILINTLGMNNINETAQKLGLQQTKLNRLMMDTFSGTQNYISANDAATILSKIGNKTLGSAAMCDKAIKYLSDQEDNLGLAQGLKQGVNFAHKTGTLSNYRHDGGIVYAGSPYVVVCLCDIGISPGNSLMQQVGSVCASNLG